MNPLNAGSLTGQMATTLSTDARSLDELKRSAKEDPAGTVKKAATQFEALFMQMVLKSMRDASPKSDLTGNDSAEQMYTGMLDQQLAGKMAESGTGLADVIARQLLRNMAPSATSGDAMIGGTAAKAAATQKGAALDAAGTKAAPRANLRALEAAMAGATGSPSDAATPTATPSVAVSGKDKQRDFVNRIWDHAVAAQKAIGIPAKFIVGQAALESGWGKQEIKSADGTPSYNLFGVKAGANWQGRTVDVMTTEYEGGVAKKVTQKFRAYDSYSDAFSDYATLLSSNKRYAQVVAQGNDSASFANGLQRAGYATDPQYGAKLTRVINTSVALRGVA